MIVSEMRMLTWMGAHAIKNDRIRNQDLRKGLYIVKIEDKRKESFCCLAMCNDKVLANW